MKYIEFIETIIQNKTSRVTALSYPDNCSMGNVPSSFKLLLPSIVNILDQNADKLCPPGEIISVIGVQITFGTICSDLPSLMGRSIDPERPKSHFCCVLSFLNIKNELKKPPCWSGQKTIVIDFSTGKIMDNQHFSFIAFGMDEPGILYGEIDNDILIKAWELANKSKLDQKCIV